jgi:hypothetical protein
MQRILGVAIAIGGLVMAAACAGMPLPTQPTAIGVAPATAISFEAEDGIGEGDLKQRSRASGGRTIHLAPGQRREWSFAFGSAPAPYALSVTYSNGQEGDNETLIVSVDGAPVSTFRNRDSGDATEGWNTFITDPAGSSLLGGRSHTLTIESLGGDGCVEIDLVTLKPVANN